MNNLGEILKEKRLILKMSQKEVAADICSQPMISSIEKGKYIPNSQILILLCQRLQIDIDSISLDSNYQISSREEFNNKITTLCNNHEYQKLREFLLQESTIDSVSNHEQTKAYYYYLGVAYLQADHNLDKAKTNFKLSLSNDDNNRKKLTTLDRLASVSLAGIFAKEGLINSSNEYLNIAFHNFDTANFETNQIALFYLAAYSRASLNKNIDAITWLDQGIEFATKHDSHYMLGNMYYLLAQLLSKSNQADSTTQYRDRSDMFAELFGEKIFKTN
ncbi:helix-turn-helix domain-containing protein [Companilactobacillus jidongensis]|uniref:helix-turn-helix domain-containing protein n=1 Tax=Companilactobacillus jidongensis TaxID=2486006 RepID=UPI001CDC7AE0|nr:helix-turn-helix transcriptional regulator [Companilactobacillus jidongensis]